MGNGPVQETLRPFDRYEDFASLLRLCSAIVQGLPTEHASLPPLGVQGAAPMGRGRPEWPETIVYLPPHERSAPRHLERLREGCAQLPDLGDRARLLHLGIQLVHPLPDANGRVGRVLHEAVMNGIDWNLRALASFAERCPYAREGTSFEFESKVCHASLANFCIGRYGIFPQLFGTDLALRVIGVQSPDIDFLETVDRARLVTHLLREDMSSAYDSLEHIFAYNDAHASFKLSLLNAFVTRELEHPSFRLSSLSVDGGGELWQFEGTRDFLRTVSASTLNELIRRSRELADDRIDHLVDMFLTPDRYPRFFDERGSTYTLKDYFDTQRFPQSRRPESYRD